MYFFYASLKPQMDITRLHLRSRVRELYQQSRGSAGKSDPESADAPFRSWSGTLAGPQADAGMWFGKSATRKMGGCRPVNMKTNGKRLRRCPDFVSYYNAPHEKTWGASQSERAT
ncbi:hypothetical protein DLR11_24585 [Salmonella enterica subsp. salamae]|nr:hypothetical protein [Salmonella enterica subsp. salamae]ECI4078625.1 hypothetical protein [Salmonella enterica subsp. salamae]